MFAWTSHGTELKRFARKPITRAAIAVMLLIPLLYGAMYVWAFWDPTTRMDKLPVALVNADTGSTRDGVSVHYGQDVVDNLVEDGSLGWATVDAATAKAGLEKGKYYFAVTIPADFSSSIVSIGGDRPKAAQIDVTYDDSNSFLASTLGKTAMMQVQESVRSKVSQEAVDTLLAALCLASIAMLATWGPLTLVPGALLAVQLATLLRARVWMRRRPLVIGALALLVLYAGLVTLPDLLRQGGALSADGGIFRFTPVQASITVGATATILFLAASMKQSWTVLVGTVTVLLSSAVGVGFLLYQRRTASELWGYYPVKFTWLISSLLLVVAAAALVSIAARLRGRFWLAALTLVAGAGLLWSTMWQTGPAYLPRIEHSSPITDIIQSSGVASLDPAANILFSVATPQQRTIDVRLGGAQYDRFANFWLLQLHSTTAKDPMRKWAYFLDPENQVKVCKAIEAWKAPVVVRTNDPGVEGRLKAQCPTADFTVQMGL